MGLLSDWGVTFDDLDEVVTDNPSLRGMVFGYVAEVMCRKIWFADAAKFSDVIKPGDHARDDKGDIRVTYRGERLRIEVKSLQTKTAKLVGDVYQAKFQCDASDRRKVLFRDGSTIETTCLLIGDFDLLAVNLFAFTKEWRFAFARNKDLPRSRYKGYSETARENLLASTMPITWPLQPPYEPEPFRLLDEIVRERASQKQENKSDSSARVLDVKRGS